MNRFLSLALAALLLAPCVSAADLPASAAPSGPETAAASAVLMEKESGAVLYEKDARQKLEPASVTKIMTLLLIMEALGQRPHCPGRHGDRLRLCRRHGRFPGLPEGGGADVRLRAAQVHHCGLRQ